jgi:hypothetical protein
MNKLLPSGNLFFLSSILFLSTAFLSEKSAVWFGLCVVFFIIGLAIRKKHAEKVSEHKAKM